jgi:hypothetical protein
MAKVRTQLPTNVITSRVVVVELKVAGPDIQTINEQFEALKDRIDHLVPNTVMRSIRDGDCRVLDRKVFTGISWSS